MMEEGTVVNWCKEGNIARRFNSLQCVPLLLCGVGEDTAAIFENGSDVGRVY